MAVLGFIAGFLLLAYLTFKVVGGALLGKAFGCTFSRSDKLILTALTGLLIWGWWLLLTNVPFTITLNT